MRGQVFTADLVNAFLLLALVLLSITVLFQVFLLQSASEQERRDLEMVGEGALRALLETPGKWDGEVPGDIGIVDSHNVLNYEKTKAFYEMDDKSAAKLLGIRGPGYNYYFFLLDKGMAVCGIGSGEHHDPCNSSADCGPAAPICCDTADRGWVCMRTRERDCNAGSRCGLGEHKEPCITNADCRPDAPICCLRKGGKDDGKVMCERIGRHIECMSLNEGIPFKGEIVPVGGKNGAGVPPINATFVVVGERDVLLNGNPVKAVLEVWK